MQTHLNDPTQLRKLLVSILNHPSCYEIDWPINSVTPWTEHIALYDSLAVELATLFANGEWPFDQADCVANDLWRHMLANVPQGEVFSDSLFEVYDAFDAGECIRVGIDPVKALTEPAISAFLAKLKS